MSAGPAGIVAVVVVLLVVFAVPVVAGAILLAPGAEVALDACTTAIGLAGSCLVPLLDVLTAAGEKAGGAGLVAGVFRSSAEVVLSPAPGADELLV